MSDRSDAPDYVIVGGGSAGCVLASRLSEDPARRVLLLEAGPDWRSTDAAPELRSLEPNHIIANEAFAALQYPDLLARRTRPQAHKLFWRGRGVGGSSNINGIIAIRNTVDDWDGWAADGCMGWTWADVLPAFCRLESDHDFGDREHHGASGPIPVWRMPMEEWGPGDRMLRDGALALGYEWAEDQNAPGVLGVSPYPINCRDRKRVTTNDAYIEPARGRPNLVVRGDALVDHVVLRDGRAVGVAVRTPKGSEEIAARRVVLCAGAVHSPAILQRSGIGPAEVLRDADVDRIIDLPVGENLQDHPLALIVVRLRERERVTAPDARHANCSVRYSSGLEGAGPGDMMLVTLNRTQLDPTFAVLGAWVNQCFSRGRLRITSRDPARHPEIDERMLDDGRDLRRLADGVRRLTAMTELDAVQSRAEAVLYERDISDDWLLANALDAQHISGTCRMGPAGDPRTVVDPSCRVLGVDGLRVIDASVFPDVPRANTHLAVLALAETMATRLD